jgi:hypothetical protein
MYKTYKTLLRSGLVVWVLFSTVAGPAHLIGRGQISSRSAASAKTWIGWWLLKVDGPRESSESTLSIKDANGKLVATIRNRLRDSIEITDISMRGNDLVLKYKQQQSGDAASAMSTLSMRPDGTFRIVTSLGQRTRSGTAKKFSVSEEFVDELLNERDNSLRFKKAQAAGLVVKRYVLDGSTTAYEIMDPSTGIVLLSGRTTVD